MAVVVAWVSVGWALHAQAPTLAYAEAGRLAAGLPMASVPDILAVMAMVAGVASHFGTHHLLASLVLPSRLTLRVMQMKVRARLQ